MSFTIYPKGGDRVRLTYGCCEGAQDMLGTVLCMTSDSFYSHIALVLLDNGQVASMIGAYTTVGIGMHLLKPSTVVA